MRLLGLSITLIALLQELYVSAIPANYHDARAVSPPVKSTSSLKTRSTLSTGKIVSTQVKSKQASSSKTARSSAKTTPVISSSRTRPISTAIRPSSPSATVIGGAKSKSSSSRLSRTVSSIATRSTLTAVSRSSSLSHSVRSSSTFNVGSLRPIVTDSSTLIPSVSENKSSPSPISSFSSFGTPSTTSAPLSSKHIMSSVSSIILTSAFLNGEGAGTSARLMGSTLYHMSTTDPLPSPSVAVSNHRRNLSTSDQRFSTVKPRTRFQNELPTRLYHGTCQGWVEDLSNPDKIKWDEKDFNEFSYNGGFYLTTDRASAVAYVTSRNRFCEFDVMKGGWAVVEYEFDSTGLEYKWPKTEAEAVTLYNQQLTLGAKWKAVGVHEGESGLTQEQLGYKKDIDPFDFIYAARPLDGELRKGSMEAFGTLEKPFDQVVIRTKKGKGALTFKEALPVTATEPYAWCVDRSKWRTPECKV